ncbi:MAG: anaerobic ribonucleoside-triphosphate reductase activating protein [Candidatus Bathyarchaeum sp.]|nr:MAG: anaerobic ribonucleoside-triphosphate reductase activating protein [Candidatus Bathyarchaeum sp.]
MDVKGFLDVSFVDWDTKISSVVFVGGCNFRCPFCHNVNLVLQPENLDTIPMVFIDEQLDKQKGWIDGVCITGGEPTLYGRLPEFCQKLKQRGLLVKLDTNGTNPALLKELIDKRLVDYVAMDVKAPLDTENYSKATGVKAEKLLEKVKQSIKLLMDSGIDYEFRTTVVPTIHTVKDIEQLCNQIKGCKKYVLQKFDVSIGKTVLDEKFMEKKIDEDEFQKYIDVAQKIIPHTTYRGSLKQNENQQTK